MKIGTRNYYIWHRKIQYLLSEVEALETLRNTMSNLKKETPHKIGIMLNPIRNGKRKTVMHALIIEWPSYYDTKV